MADAPKQKHDADREKKRKKALRRMGKMLTKAWELPNAEPFQTYQYHGDDEKGKSSILCLTSLGIKVDAEGYGYGRHGWEDFARDIGGIYALHLKRKTKHAKLAEKHLERVCGMLAEKDDSLAQAARNAPAPKLEKRRSSGSGGAGTAAKKRKASATGSASGDGTLGKRLASSSESGKKTNDASAASSSRSSSKTDIAEREVRGMENLITFIEKEGGDRKMVKKYRCRVTIKPSDGRYDVNYFNEHGKRFRSMIEVGRFLNLVDDKAGPSSSRRSAAATAGIGNLKKKRKRGGNSNTATSSKQIEAEKKRLRKELEKLRKQYGRATKALDNFLEDDKDAQYPVEDSVLQEEIAAAASDGNISSTSTILPTNCPAARNPDIDSFAGLPKHCMSEALQAWDFLCTFSRALSLQPISLDDFLLCLNYKPPSKAIDSDTYKAPPVYLGEAHLGLLKLLLGDPSSDEWWWSILETEQSENAVLAHNESTKDASVKEEEEESDLPLIRINFAALLSDPEDPLITNSWLRVLQPIRTIDASDAASIKKALDEGTKLVANKWVLAFFRKAIKLGKTSGPSFMKQAVVWLLDKVAEAKPELQKGRITSEVLKKRAKVVEEVEQQMEKLSSATLTVNDDDFGSDAEEDDDDDDSDDECESENKKIDHANSTPGENRVEDQPASFIPRKPQPTLVDLLLPPGKPTPSENSQLFSPSSWPCMVGAAACRVVHRYKRLRNEVDDGLRRSRELSQLTVKERRERESISSDRVFSAFVTGGPEDGSIEHALEILCSGGDYLDLSPFERLAMLRILIDAAYDTNRVYEVVSSNHNQRTNAVKALDVEQRRAKREAKEKAATDITVARKDLAMEARHNFIEEKREEIRKLNENNQELTAEDIDTLTEQDILDFDEDIKAEFDALPTPESFKKTEVVARVSKLQEAAAFETESLIIVTMEELLEREKKALATMEEDLKELGGEDALLDPYLDRSIARRIEKIRRDIRKAKESAEYLPEDRADAIESLREAMLDGTIKSLRGAIRTAKSAKLFGPDDETNGVWSLDIVRDAHMELENAKQLKRVADAQKDLISKLNKCFIRTEPVGFDRFRNRFWRFESSGQSHVWTEVNLSLKTTDSTLLNHNGFIEVVNEPSKVFVGPSDFEEDFPTETDGIEFNGDFKKFGRQEYHDSGEIASLAIRKWGCHVNESSIKALMKGLDSRGIRESSLKKSLKEALEEKATSGDGVSEIKEQLDENEKMTEGMDEGGQEEEETERHDKADGDEAVFEDAKKSALDLSSGGTVSVETIQSLESSAIGEKVRIRKVVDSNKDGEICRYDVASIVGWKIRKDQVSIDREESEFEPQLKTVSTPLWRARTEHGNEVWLTGSELIESICRYKKWIRNDDQYFEHDAAFLAFRNNLGRHCGKAADAPHAMTPIRFSQYMVKCEAELYQKLKVLTYDNNWGGKSGSRNAWITSMREYSFDFQTAKDGLVTLENAFFELVGGDDQAEGNDLAVSGKDLLSNPDTREHIELESIETNVSGLWSSKASRNVFLEIVSNATSTGFLTLALELMCRNTRSYLTTNGVKSANVGLSSSTQGYEQYAPLPMRTTRRMNAWQQSQGASDWDNLRLGSTRSTRSVINYAED